AHDVEQRAVVSAQRGFELNRDDELPLAQEPRKLRLVRFLAADDRQTSLVDEQRPGRRTVLVDRRADRLDLRGRRPTAAADESRAEGPRLRGELREVFGRGMGIDNARAGQ